MSCCPTLIDAGGRRALEALALMHLATHLERSGFVGFEQHFREEIAEDYHRRVLRYYDQAVRLALEEVRERIAKKLPMREQAQGEVDA